MRLVHRLLFGAALLFVPLVATAGTGSPPCSSCPHCPHCPFGHHQ